MSVTPGIAPKGLDERMNGRNVLLTLRLVGLLATEQGLATLDLIVNGVVVLDSVSTLWESEVPYTSDVAVDIMVLTSPTWVSTVKSVVWLITGTAEGSVHAPISLAAFLACWASSWASNLDLSLIWCVILWRLGGTWAHLSHILFPVAAHSVYTLLTIVVQFHSAAYKFAS